MKLMVVDDHPMWKDAIVKDLETAGHTVVATAADGRSAIQRAKATQPDVIVLDLNLPEKSGVEVTEEIIAHNAEAKILILSASGEQKDVLQALKAGATGYLTKSASSPELLKAIENVSQGDTVLTPGLAGLVLGEYNAEENTKGPTLTDREKEILRMVAKGLEYKQIAARLYLSHRTVQNHIQNTLKKLQMHNRAQLVRYAIEQGIAD